MRIAAAAYPAGSASTTPRNNSAKTNTSPLSLQHPQFGGATRIAPVGYPTEIRTYPTRVRRTVIPQADEPVEKPKSQGSESSDSSTESSDPITLPSFRPITAIQPHTARFPAAGGPGLPNDVARSVLGQYPPIQTWGSNSASLQSNRSTYAFRHLSLIHI